MADAVTRSCRSSGASQAVHCRVRRIVVAALLGGPRRPDPSRGTAVALHQLQLHCRCRCTAACKACSHNIARLLGGLWFVEDHCCPARVLDLHKKMRILLFRPCCCVCLPHAPSGPPARHLRPRELKSSDSCREQRAKRAHLKNGLGPPPAQRL